MFLIQPCVGLYEKLCKKKDQKADVWNLKVKKFCGVTAT